jgi:predicted amidohydrolase
MAETRYKAAAIQYEPALKDVAGNRERLLALTEKAARKGSRLIVLPEMATTGYCFYDRAEIAPYVESIPGPTTELFGTLAAEHDAYIVLGMAEVDPQTGVFYNSAALIRPEGGVEKMRKVHLFVSDTRWAKDGDLGFPVWETDVGLLAAIICMDASFFESSRVPALLGADVICLPTNWVNERAPAMDWFTRAFENGVYFIAADRYGEERGVQFSGGSCLIDPRGGLISLLDTGEGIVEGQIDLAKARAAKTRSPGRGGRRPKLYADLSLNPLLWPMRYSRDLYGQRPLPEGERAAVAVLQPPSVPDKPLQAREMYASLVEAARALAEEPLELVVLPELSLVHDLGQAGEMAERIPGPSSEWAAELARKMGIYLVAGLAETDGSERYNTAILVGPDGVIGRWRQRHLDREAYPWATRGDEALQTWDIPLGRIGMLIGNEAWFPEVGRCLAIQGADLICAPAAMSQPAPIDLPPTEVPLAEEILATPDEAYWHLWRARAAENNTYLAFANRADAGCIGWSGVFGPDPFGFARTDTLIRGGSSACAVAIVDTHDYRAPERPNPARFKDLVRMRMPRFYGPLVSAEAASSD